MRNEQLYTFKKQYAKEEILDAGRCPICKCNDVVGDEVVVEQRAAEQEVTCSGCGRMFSFIFTLSDIVLISDPVKEEGDVP